jgi:hypothetical protein
MKYYAVVINKYPNTEYAASVKYKYDYYESLNKKDSVSAKDSLMKKDSLMTKDSLMKNDSLKIKDSTRFNTDTLKTSKPEDLKDSLKNQNLKNTDNDNTNPPDKKENGETPKELIKPEEKNGK